MPFPHPLPVCAVRLRGADPGLARTRARSLGRLPFRRSSEFFAELTIIPFEENNAIRVPVAALFREGEGFAAFVVEGDTARKRAVKAPRRNATEALVEEGLQPGEQVVVYPSDALREGARVEVARNAQR